ncbi:hypothetical protein QN399_25580 [Pseudomonas sp. 10C3]|uniref:hypothetical protein n=1 Tax=Pseudomonas sp. 10C3 TaxID=3118753 RepID=UPI002E7FB495|nr:hypothetical protein [Pseudomonas sp. 10C3]MEE3509575.1 hypothetical protein [Pseudomonas sp. 10C3]
MSSTMGKNATITDKRANQRLGVAGDKEEFLDGFAARISVLSEHPTMLEAPYVRACKQVLRSCEEVLRLCANPRCLRYAAPLYAAHLLQPGLNNDQDSASRR